MGLYDTVLFYSTVALGFSLGLALFSLLYVTGGNRGQKETLFTALVLGATALIYGVLALRVVLSLECTLWLSLIILFCLNLFLISLLKGNRMIRRDVGILLLFLVFGAAALLNGHFSLTVRTLVAGLVQVVSCVYTLLILVRRRAGKGWAYRVMLACYALFALLWVGTALFYLKPWLPFRIAAVGLLPLLVGILACGLLEFVEGIEGERAAGENGWSYLEDVGGVEDVVISLARAIDAMDKYTEGHIERVAQYAAFLGERLGLSVEELETLRVGALIHDIGKIGIDLSILNKPGRLTEEEFEQIKKHPVVGAEICSPLKALAETAQIVRSHHEKLDGSGYPDGLKGDEIPLLARIVAIADIFDALTTDRPYRPAYSIAKAVHILRQDAAAGKLDARLVEEFISLINDTMVFD